MRYAWLIVVIALLGGPMAFGQSLTIQGKVTNASGQPVAGNNTQFRVQILAPDSGGCILYDESFVVDLSTSYGLFSLNLNGGTGTRNAPSTYTLEQAISNRAGFSTNSSYCKTGSGTVTYIPASTDNRKVVIKFLDPATMGSTWETIPEMDLNPVAYAMESRVLGGFPASSVLRVQEPTGPAPAAAFSAAQFADLQALVGGTSNKYMVSGSGSSEGARLPTASGRPASPTAGSIWFDTVTGSVKYYDGSGDRTIGSSGAGGASMVTSVAGGAGITASSATGAITISLTASGVGAASTVGSASAIPEIEFDTYGRIVRVDSHPINGLLPAAGADHQVLMSTSGSWGPSYVGLADLRKDAGTPLFPGTCATNRTLNWNSVSGVFECVDLGSIASSQLAAPTGAAAGTYRSVSVNAAGQVLAGTNPTTLGGYFISDAVRNGGSVPQIRSGAADPSGAGVDGELYVATGSQKIFRYNLGTTTWETMASAGGAGGTMTGITAGSGIAVSGSATTPTVSLSTTGVTAGTFARVTTDAYGRVTSGSAQVGDADIADLAFTKLTGKPATLLGHGITENLVTNAGGAASLQAGPTSGRPAPGVAGQIYIDTDTNTVYYRGASTWQTVASAAGSGGTLTEVYSGAGVNVAGSGTTRTVALTDVGTASTGLVKVNTDAKGRVTGGATTIGNAEISDLAFSKLTGTPTSVGGYGITDAVKNTDGTVPNILSGNDSAKPTPVAGNLNFIYIANDTQRIYRQIGGAWQVIGAGTTANFSGSLVGEVTGTQGTTQVSQIGSFLRATILGYFGDLQNATDAKTNGALVKRDGSGGFSVGAVTADSVVLKGSTAGNAGVRAPATVSTSYTLELPAAPPGANGQVLQSTTGGVLSWVTPFASTAITVSAPLRNTAGTLSIDTASGSQPGALSSGDWTTFNNKLGTALTAASIWVGNASNVATAVAPAGDVAMSNAGAFTVNGIKGQNISAAGASAGQVLRYAGSNTWTPNFVGIRDLRSNITGSVALSSTCTASQTLTWDSAGDNLTCQNISIAAATQISGVLPIANGGTGTNSTSQGFVFAGPASGTGVPAFRALQASDLTGVANQWSELSGNVYRNSGSVGIGTSAPMGPLHIASGGNALSYLDSYTGSGTDGNAVIYRQARGTAVAPTATQAGDRLTFFGGRGYGATGFAAASQSAISMFAAENFTDSAMGSHLVFETSPLGSTGRGERMRITSQGFVGIGSTIPNQILDVGGSARINGEIQGVSNSATAQLRLVRNNFGTLFRNDGTDFYILQTASADQFGTWTSARPFSFNFASGSVNLANSSVVAIPSGGVGIGTSAPTAALHVKAGTATANTAPLKFTSGTNLTTPENGAMEFDGTNYYLTAAGVRRAIALAGGGNSFSSVSAGAGSNATPSFSFSGDPDTGFYNTNSDNTISVAAGGAKLFDFSSAGLTSPTNGGAAVTSANGTAAAPTYGFAGDAGLGWFRPAASTLAAATGGVERMRIDSSGNVGIGTTNPLAKLDVVGPINFGMRQGGGNQPGYLSNNWTASGNYRFATLGSSYFDGTNWLTNPSANFGSNVVSTIIADTGGVAFLTQTSTGNTARSDSNAIFNSYERMRISASGNVGIGTTTPGSALEVAGTGQLRVSGSTPRLTLNPAASGTSNLWNIDNNGGKLRFFREDFTATGTGASGADRMTILDNGNVGIGTTGPTNLLHINTATTNDGLLVTGVQTAGNTTSLSLRANMGSGSYNGLSQTGDAGLIYGGTTIGNAKGFVIAPWMSGYGGIRLDNNGNVGIGTATPTATLDVNGTIRALAQVGAPLRSISTNGWYKIGTIVNTLGNGYGGRFSITILGANGFGMANAELGETKIIGSTQNNAVSTRANISGHFYAVGGNPVVTDVKFVEGANRFTYDVYANVMGFPSYSISAQTVPGVTWTETFTSVSDPGADSATVIAALRQFTVPGGNVGIGTALPDSRLTLQDGGAGQISFKNSSGTTVGYIGTSSIDGAASTDQLRIRGDAGMLFSVVGAPKMVVMPSGNIGIGTTSPANPLQVVGNSNYGIAELVANGTNAESAIGFRASNIARANAGNWVLGSNLAGVAAPINTFSIYAGGVGGVVNIAPSGNVGIGVTAPISQFQIGGANPGFQWGSSSTASDNFHVYADSVGGTRGLRFYGGNAGAGTGLMTLTSTGRLGIGNVAPTQLLDVNGTARINSIQGGQLNSDGNLHIDAHSSGIGRAVYLNWYQGSGGAYVGNGSTNLGPMYASVYNTSSDRTLKKNIEPIAGALDRLRRINGVRFDWIDAKRGKERQVGLIAQEVQKEFPELVSQTAYDKKLTVNYSGMVSPLIQAVKELYEKITGVNARVDALEKKVAEKDRELASVKAKAEADAAAMRARLDRLEKLLEKK